MKSDDKESKVKKLEEQRNKAIKSLTDYKESNLPISTAADYLTFVAGSGESSVEVRYQDENIWLTQKMMAELYGVDRSVITKHLKKVFLDDELEENSVCAIFAHTASDEKIYKVKFYALQAVIAVGFKIDNQRAVQFRKWIIAIAKDYTIKGFVMEKRGLGLPMYDTPNAVEELKHERKHPTPEKVEAIKDAFKYFELIQ